MAYLNNGYRGLEGLFGEEKAIWRRQNELFAHLNNTITTSTLQDIKQLVRGYYLGYGELERCNTMSDILEALDIRSVITMGRYEKLKILLKEAGVTKLVRDVEKAEHDIEEIARRGFSIQFHRLCASGKIKVHRQRVAIVGPYGVGKTHLAKRLLQEKYDEGKDATTPGVKIYRHRCIIHKAGRSRWVRGKDDPEDQFVQHMAIGIQAPSTSQQPADRTLSAEIPPDWEAPPPVDSGSDDYLKGAAAPPPGDSGSDDYLKGAAGPPSGDSGSDDYLKGAAERINVKEIDPMLLAKIEAMARGKTVEPEKQITIWDFAGQDIYYTTHQTFLSEQNIYLLVFRLDLGLNAEITVYRRKKTVKEFIVFWLNSIHMHTIGKSTEEDKNICPRVFIIGTHKDKVNAQDADKIFVDLGEYLDDKQVLKGHVHGYFAISNLASEVEFDGIKGAIEELCDDISSSGVSVSWIQLEMNLAKKSEEKPIISMVELCEMAQVVGLPDRELHDSFIPEHHRLGDILHFKVDGLENVVIIDPLWLADRFSEIMTPVNIKSGSGYLDIQQGDLIRGVLKEEVFDAYLHKIKMTERKTDLIQLMLHFDLMLEISQSVENPLPYFGKRTFIVPSMLVPSDSVDPALSETDPKKYLLISFPHVMFHPGLFHRLIIRLLRKYKAQRYKKNIPVVGFDRASFLLEDDKSVLHLVIEDKDMKMMITNASPSPTGPHIYSNARQTVVEELEILLKAYCPRLQFCYCIRDKNDGPNIQIKADDVYKNDFVSKYVENSAKSIDLRPYRVWFSAAGKVPHSPQPLAEAAGKVPHSPQPLDEAVGKVPHKLQPLNEDMYELLREQSSSLQIKEDSSSECTKQEAANGQGFSLDPSSHHHHHYHYNTTYCTHNNINNCQYVQVGNENVMERVPEFLSEPPSDAEHLDLDTNPR